MKSYSRLALLLLLAWIAGNLLWYYGENLYFYYQMWGIPKTDSIEAGPIKLTLSNSTDWSTVGKMLVTVLGTYAGIKLINKWTK